MTDLEELARRVASCQDCDLCRNRTHAVPGEGSPAAEIMFVGEGPGFHEDQQARPFVGPAGKFLEEMLGAIGYKRNEVYITNVVKCRPPNNRDPMPAEVDACRKYLLSQIDLIKPRLIVTLGRYSLAWFFPQDAIGKMHGQLRQRDGQHFMHMYHPAAALHAGNLRSTIEDDFRKIPQALVKVREMSMATQEAVAGEASAEQMRLFQ